MAEGAIKQKSDWAPGKGSKPTPKIEPESTDPLAMLSTNSAVNPGKYFPHML